jgi:hypothetical protein
MECRGRSSAAGRDTAVELYGLCMSHLVPAVVITPGNCIEAPFTLSHEIMFDGVVRVLREGLSAC